MKTGALPFNFAIPEAITGTSGIYHLYSESPDKNKVFLQLGVVACPGRMDGQTYHAAGLMVRVLFAGDDPVLPPAYENRGKRGYKSMGSESEDVYAHQLNKMLFPIATMNIGSEAMLAAVDIHLEALAELLNPLLEKNSQVVKFPLMTIFEAQNPGLTKPVVNFPPPKEIKSWETTVAEMKAAATAGYQPKSSGLPPPPELGNLGGENA